MKVSHRARAAGFATVALLIGFGAACTPGGGHGHGETAAPRPSRSTTRTDAAAAGHVASQGYQCCRTREFGDEVSFAGTARKLTSATVTMSNWAWKSPTNAPSDGNATGWDQLLTLNLYAVGPRRWPPDRRRAAREPSTQVFHIPWRPDPDSVNCPTKDTPATTTSGSRRPVRPDTNCFNGHRDQGHVRPDQPAPHRAELRGVGRRVQHADLRREPDGRRRSMELAQRRDRRAPEQPSGPTSNRPPPSINSTWTGAYCTARTHRHRDVQRGRRLLGRLHAGDQLLRHDVAVPSGDVGPSRSTRHQPYGIVQRQLAILADPRRAGRGESMKASHRTRAAGFATIALLIGFGTACTSGGGGHGGGGGPMPVKIYDSNPSPLPGNVASIGFSATSTSELGDEVTLAGTARKLTSATVTMSQRGAPLDTGEHRSRQLDRLGRTPDAQASTPRGPAHGRRIDYGDRAQPPVVAHIPWRPEHNPQRAATRRPSSRHPALWAPTASTGTPPRSRST